MTDLLQIEVEGAEALALQVHPAFVEDPALRVMDKLLDFLEDPQVEGVLPLTLLDEGVFAYPREGRRSLREVFRALMAQDQAGGTRAGLELLYQAGVALVELATAGEGAGLFSFGALTPERVLLDPQGRVDLIGAGIPPVDVQIFLDDDRFLPPASSTRYAPPERLLGRAEDYLSDLYAAALLSAEMMVGAPVYDGGDQAVFDLAVEGLADERVEALGLPPNVIDLLLLMLAPNPDERPEDPFAWLDQAAALAEEAEGPSLAEVVEETAGVPLADETGDLWTAPAEDAPPEKQVPPPLGGPSSEEGPVPGANAALSSAPPPPAEAAAAPPADLIAAPPTPQPPPVSATEPAPPQDPAPATTPSPLAAGALVAVVEAPPEVAPPSQRPPAPLPTEPPPAEPTAQEQAAQPPEPLPSLPEPDEAELARIRAELAALESARLKTWHAADKVSDLEAKAASIAARAKAELASREEDLAQESFLQVKTAAAKAVVAADRIRGFARDAQGATRAPQAEALVHQTALALREAEQSLDLALSTFEEGIEALRQADLQRARDALHRDLDALTAQHAEAVTALQQLEATRDGLRSPGYAVKGAYIEAKEALAETGERAAAFEGIRAQVDGASQAVALRELREDLEDLLPPFERALRRTQEATSGGMGAVKAQRDQEARALTAVQDRAAAAARGARQAGADLEALTKRLREVMDREGLRHSSLVDLLGGALAEVQAIAACAHRAEDAVGLAVRVELAEQAEPHAIAAEQALADALATAARGRERADQGLAEAERRIAETQAARAALDQARAQIGDLLAQTEGGVNQIQQAWDAADRALKHHAGIGNELEAQRLEFTAGMDEAQAALRVVSGAASRLPSVQDPAQATSMLQSAQESAGRIAAQVPRLRALSTEVQAEVLRRTRARLKTWLAEAQEATKGAREELERARIGAKGSALPRVREAEQKTVMEVEAAASATQEIQTLIEEADATEVLEQITLRFEPAKKAAAWAQGAQRDATALADEIIAIVEADRAERARIEAERLAGFQARAEEEQTRAVALVQDLSAQLAGPREAAAPWAEDEAVQAQLAAIDALEAAAAKASRQAGAALNAARNAPNSAKAQKDAKAAEIFAGRSQAAIDGAPELLAALQRAVDAAKALQSRERAIMEAAEAANDAVLASNEAQNSLRKLQQLQAEHEAGEAIQESLLQEMRTAANLAAHKAGQSVQSAATLPQIEDADQAVAQASEAVRASREALEASGLSQRLLAQGEEAIQALLDHWATEAEALERARAEIRTVTEFTRAAGERSEKLSEELQALIKKEGVREGEATEALASLKARIEELWRLDDVAVEAADHARRIREAAQAVQWAAKAKAAQESAQILLKRAEGEHNRASAAVAREIQGRRAEQVNTLAQRAHTALDKLQATLAQVEEAVADAEGEPLPLRDQFLARVKEVEVLVGRLDALVAAGMLAEAEVDRAQEDARTVRWTEKEALPLSEKAIALATAQREARARAERKRLDAAYDRVEALLDRVEERQRLLRDARTSAAAIDVEGFGDQVQDAKESLEDALTSLSAELGTCLAEGNACLDNQVRAEVEAAITAIETRLEALAPRQDDLPELEKTLLIAKAEELRQREEARLKRLEEERLKREEELRLKKLEEERLKKLEEERLRKLEEERLKREEEERQRAEAERLSQEEEERRFKEEARLIREEAARRRREEHLKRRAEAAATEASEPQAGTAPPGGAPVDAAAPEEEEPSQGGARFQGRAGPSARGGARPLGARPERGPRREEPAAEGEGAEDPLARLRSRRTPAEPEPHSDRLARLRSRVAAPEADATAPTEPPPPREPRSEAPAPPRREPRSEAPAPPSREPLSEAPSTQLPQPQGLEEGPAGAMDTGRARSSGPPLDEEPSDPRTDRLARLRSRRGGDASDDDASDPRTDRLARLRSRRGDEPAGGDASEDPPSDTRTDRLARLRSRRGGDASDDDASDPRTDRLARLRSRRGEEPTGDDDASDTRADRLARL
ncbi:MAG: hypothetical protein JXX28_10320, partial [Deltaproteobacteria bacterium]|nr:hypothetical protein [Deltaproteobacteria bacterium]